MAEFSDAELRKMMGTLSLLVQDSRREINHLHDKLENNSDSKYQSLETYINSKYADTIKSFEKLKYLDIDNSELVNTWIMCFNQVKGFTLRFLMLSWRQRTRTKLESKRSNIRHTQVNT